MTPEEQAREHIDRMLTESGWGVQDAKATNLYTELGVAVREFILKDEHGRADYLLHVKRAAAGTGSGPGGSTSRGPVEQPLYDRSGARGNIRRVLLVT